MSKTRSGQQCDCRNSTEGSNDCTPATQSYSCTFSNLKRNDPRIWATNPTFLYEQRMRYACDWPVSYRFFSAQGTVVRFRNASQTRSKARPGQQYDCCRRAEILLRVRMTACPPSNLSSPASSLVSAQTPAKSPSHAFWVHNPDWRMRCACGTSSEERISLLRRAVRSSFIEHCTFISQGAQMQGIKIFAGEAGDVRKGNGAAEDKSQTI